MINWDKLFGLDREPVPHPWSRPAAPVPDKPRATRQEDPDNLVYHAGRAFVQEAVDEHVFEDTLYGGQGVRSALVETADKEALYDAGLDEERYRLLKPYWAAGVSARDAAKAFRGKRGFSPRTIDKYWRVFNQVQSQKNPSPAS